MVTGKVNPLQNESVSRDLAFGPQGLAPLSIALMLESDGPGGAEIMILRLAEELRHRGHSVIPVGPDNGCGWLAERFRDLNFVSETFHLRRAIDLKCLRQLAGLLRDRAVDVVHSHEFTMSVYGAAAAQAVGKPHVITHHSNMYFSRRWRRRVAMRWACRNSAATIAVSDVTRQQLEEGLGLPPGSVGVVYNGVSQQPGSRDPIRREIRAAEEDVLVAAIGTVEPRKGHILLLKAFSEIESRRDDLRWRLVIAGQDRYEARNLREFAESHGFGERLHLLGHRADIGDILAGADIFAMPSLHEGLPMALLEGMMAGLPVIASTAGGMAEVITSEVEGILVPVGNVAALSAALERLLANGTERKRLGAAARERAKNSFSLETMGTAYETIYRSLAEENH